MSAARSCVVPDAGKPFSMSHLTPFQCRHSIFQDFVCSTCRSEKALQATVVELQQQVDGAREAHALVVAELDVRAGKT